MCEDEWMEGGFEMWARRESRCMTKVYLYLGGTTEHIRLRNTGKVRAERFGSAASDELKVSPVDQRVESQFICFPRAQVSASASSASAFAVAGPNEARSWLN